MSYDEMVALDEDDSTRSLSNHTRDSRTAVSNMIGAEHLAEGERSCLICLADVVSGNAMRPPEIWPSSRALARDRFSYC